MDMKSLFPPVVTQIGHDIVHDINQEWNDSLLLITIEHHVQKMSQHLMISIKKTQQFSTKQTFLQQYAHFRNVMMSQNIPQDI